MIQKLPNQPYHRPNDRLTEIPVVTHLADDQFATETTSVVNLRTKRRIFTVVCTAFTIGILLILCNSPYKNEFLAPGPLSSNHAQLLSGEGSARCASCHSDANGSFTNWIANTISNGTKQGLSQSELCLKCHDKSLSIDFAMNPHNVEPVVLAEKTSQLESQGYDARMGFHPPVHDTKIACNACHREHHGTQFDLAAMTDAQCQSCHKNSFHSFATNHPEFENYPLKRRSGIAFDHASHVAKHFPGKNAAFDCRQCHIDDDFQNVKKLASFEQGCATCHESQMKESFQQNLVFLSLPMVDTDAIENNQLSIGTWPLHATGDFDGPLPAIMRGLLRADERAANVLDRYDVSFEFGDIDPDDKDQVRDAVELVWAIKRLLHDLAVNGKRAIRSRLEAGFGKELSQQQMAALTPGLDEFVFQNTVTRWLPNLATELRQFDLAEDSQRQALLPSIAVDRENGGWWPTDERLYNVDQEDKLLAENPLKGKIKPIQPIAQHATPQNPDPVTPSDDQQVDSDPRQTPPSLFRNKTTVIPDDELLAINPLQQMGRDPGGIQSQLENSKLQPIQSAANDASRDNDPTATESADPWPTHELTTTTATGWIRDDGLLQIGYRPQTHSDDCLKNWIELATRVSSESPELESNPLFQTLLKGTSIGLCRTCHTVDETANHQLQVNWSPHYRDPSKRAFTNFSHGPHLILPQLHDCASCHQLDLDQSNQTSFISTNAAEIVSNFKPITKSGCATCHSENQANSGCTQCHSYHVGSHVTGQKK